MPIYAYQCQACENVHEALQKMSDEPLTTCPECDAQALKKLVSAPRFRLAGGGWYETDFKKDNQRNLAKSDSGSEASTSSSSSNTSTKSSDNATSKKAANE